MGLPEKIKASDETSLLIVWKPLSLAVPPATPTPKKGNCSDAAGMLTGLKLAEETSIPPNFASVTNIAAAVMMDAAMPFLFLASSSPSIAVVVVATCFLSSFTSLLRNTTARGPTRQPGHCWLQGAVSMPKHYSPHCFTLCTLHSLMHTSIILLLSTLSNIFYAPTRKRKKQNEQFFHALPCKCQNTTHPVLLLFEACIL